MIKDSKGQRFGEVFKNWMQMINMVPQYFVGLMLMLKNQMQTSESPL